MLSILIPVYNFDIRALVKTLVQQCQKAQIEYEIRCLDDASSAFKTENQEVAQWEGVKYEELAQNLGRSKIRNQLGRAARFDYLLFMDCDSQVNHSNYIQTYLDHLKPQVLLYGGRSYSTNPPKDEQYYLHWHYGSVREQQTAAQRSQQAYHAFMTNNFLIPKAIFLQVGFEEELRQYGHEDTLFGLALQELGVPIVHLDNPLEHIGLENASVFLQKSRMAIENLWYLQQSHQVITTTLLRTYQSLHQWQFTPLIKWTYRIFKKGIQRNLCSPNAQLKLFDLFKLATLIEVAESQS